MPQNTYYIENKALRASKGKNICECKTSVAQRVQYKNHIAVGSYQTNGMVNYAGELKDGKTNWRCIFRPIRIGKGPGQPDCICDRMEIPCGFKILPHRKTVEDPDNYIRPNGKKAILLSLEMQPGYNIVEFGQDVDKAIATFKKTCPSGIEVAKISELPKYVDDSVSNFMKEFFIAIIAVVLVTMALLPLRVASVAGITVLSLCDHIGLLYFFGVELNTVSLAALIIVLGMIVDNSIVVIDNHVEKIGHGFRPGMPP
jgi:hypothetical protein